MSGPINVAGSYTFATRLGGVTHLSGFTRAATRVEFPPLGPRELPSDQRRRFFTPFDLMVFGFSPVVPVYPRKGQTLAQLARRPRLARLRRHGSLEGDRPAQGQDPRGPLQAPWSYARRCGSRATASAAARARCGSRRTRASSSCASATATAASRPSSGPASAVRAVLRTVAALALVALAGCGGDDDPRAQVRAYLDSANELQRGAADEFKRAGEDYLAFARGELGPGVAIERLERSESDIRATRDRLAGLHPPREAVALHSKLQRVYDMNLELAHETSLLAAYQRGADRALAPLDRYNRGLDSGAAPRRRCRTSRRARWRASPRG